MMTTSSDSMILQGALAAYGHTVTVADCAAYLVSDRLPPALEADIGAIRGQWAHWVRVAAGRSMMSRAVTTLALGVARDKGTGPRRWGTVTQRRALLQCVCVKGLPLHPSQVRLLRGMARALGISIPDLVGEWLTAALEHVVLEAGASAWDLDAVKARSRVVRHATAGERSKPPTV